MTKEEFAQEKERLKQAELRKRRLRNRPIKYYKSYDGEVQLPFIRRLKRYLASTMVFTFFFIMIVVVLAIVIILKVALSIRSPGDINLSVMYIDDNGELKKHNIALTGEASLRNDRLYVPVMEILERYGLIVTGRRGEYTFYVSGSEESFKLDADSNSIYINGVRQRSITPLYSNDGSIYLPLDYLCAKIPAITYTTEEQKKGEVIVIEKEGELYFNSFQTVSIPGIDEQEAIKLGIIEPDPEEVPEPTEQPEEEEAGNM